MTGILLLQCAASDDERLAVMMAHTPGPWRSSLVRNFFAIEAELPCINGLRAWFTVAVVHQSDEAEKGMSDGLKADAIDDARLIAAAPDLLNALIEVKHGTEYPDDLGDIIDAAISKALGK